MIANGSRIVHDDRKAEPAPPSSDWTTAVREQTNQILADNLFHTSKRCSDMLRYIVERTLHGENDCLKERIIGIEVFGRTPDYDTGLDSSVRNTAAEIRKRLTRYYEVEAHGKQLRIVLPLGSYIADFHAPEPVLDHPSERPAVQPPAQPVLDTAASSPKAKRRLLAWAAVIAILFTLTATGLSHFYLRRNIYERFWAPLVAGPGPVLILIGSPVPDKQRPSPRAPAAGSTDSSVPLEEFIAKQVNYPVADLNAANAITSLLARRNIESNIRFSGSTNLSDLHGEPFVVLGSFLNEWALRLGTNLPFQFRHNDIESWIEDPANPLDRKWMIVNGTPIGQVAYEYTLVTRCLDRSTGQWWIGVGGLTVLGTIAVQQTLIDPHAMESFSAQLPPGWDKKNLQLVVAVRMINGSAGTRTLIASRSW